MENRRSPDWSKLPPELLELVAAKIDFIDVLYFKGVCSSFRLAAKVRSPLLMHQSTTDCGGDDDFHRKFGKTVRFLSPQDMNAVIYSPQGKTCLERLLDKGCCVGSSHGWLVVLDKEANPFLLNPFSGAEIELPKKKSLIDRLNRDYDHIRVDYHECVPKIAGSFFRRSTISSEFDYGGMDYVPAIQRAILTTNPSYAEDYKVFVICRDLLAFCCRGDRKWRPLHSLPKSSYDVAVAVAFHDVAFHNSRLYAIQEDLAPFSTYSVSTKIRTWDLSSTLRVPQECGCIVISDFVKEVGNKLPDCRVSYYLVSSSEDLFLVFRFTRATTVGFVINKRRATTVGFEIYKLEGEYGKKFVRVESLPRQAMFLGGNHGMVISVQDYGNKLKENSIYFTYDYEDAYLNYYSYEIGIYSLENGSVNLLCDEQEKKPVPFWVFPGHR